MSRLLTVVNERKKLRSEYRQHLEQEYIKEQKAEEMKKLREEAENSGKKVPPSQQQVRKYLVEKEKKQKQKINHVREEMIEKYESTKGQESQSLAAPLLDESDITFVA